MVFYGVLLFGYISSWFNKRLFFYILWIILAALAFFRFGIGIDYFAYGYLFNNLNSSVLMEMRYGNGEQEIGFRVIGSFMKSLGLDYQKYLVVFSFINLFYIGRLCKRYSINPTLSLLLFFCFYYVTWVFSAIRQGLVIAVGLFYLFKCIEEKKALKLVVISLLLSLIHVSAIILIVFYILSTINFKKKTLISVSIVSVVFSFLPIGALVSKLVWLPVIGNKLVYVDSSIILNTFDFQSIARVLLLIMALTFYDYYSKQDEMSKKIINIYIISIIMYFFFQFSELIASRLAIYGKFLDIIILANVLYFYKKRINRLLYVFAILLLCSFYLYKETDTQISKELDSEYKFPPYVNVINKEEYNFKSMFRNLED